MVEIDKLLKQTAYVCGCQHAYPCIEKAELKTCFQDINQATH